MKKILAIICSMTLLLGVMIPVSALSSGGATISLGSLSEVDIDTTTTIDIPVSITKNPGLAGGTLNVEFDGSAFTFTKAVAGEGLGANCSFTPPRKNQVSPLPLTFDGMNPVEETDKVDGVMVTLTFTLAAGIEAGKTYNFTLTMPGTMYTVDESYDTIEYDDITLASGTVTTKSKTPAVTAKTVSYTAANGTVMASTVALAAPAEAKPSGSIVTAGTAAEEEVYFYFFPNKGFTTDGMTVNGAEVIGAAASKKYTVTADATYDFVFKKIEDAAAITAKPTGAISGTPAAASLTTFATAAGASEFGILIGAADAWGTDITADYAAASETGKIRKYAALEANGEGQFAIELNDTAKNFLKNGTYRAYIYAANGSIVTFGDAIDIAIAE